MPQIQPRLASQASGDAVSDPVRLHPAAAGALAAGRLTVRRERRGAEHRVTVCGELDLATGQGVEDELRAAEASDAEQITLDLSGLDFIDSTGLRLIIMAGARSRASGGRRLLRGPRQVQRVFEISGTADVLPFAD